MNSALSWKGTVVSVQIAAKAGDPMVSLKEVRAEAGRGLEGDRYFNRVGTYSNRPGAGRDITLIEVEAIEALGRDLQIELDPGMCRRNIVTRNVPLNHLVAREFIAGSVRLLGVRLCEPCTYLESLTKEGVKDGLVHRGGLRANILTSGIIREGDLVHPC
jgi:MOSC domain-containing protein YiiM